MKSVHNKSEDDDVKEPESNNKVGWLLYKAKFWLLLLGYILVFVSFTKYIS